MDILTDVLTQAEIDLLELNDPVIGKAKLGQKVKNMQNTVNASFNVAFIAADDAVTTSDDRNVAGLSSAYTLLVDLRAKYIAHCAMGAGTHTTVDVVNNAPVAIASSSLASMKTAANDLKAKYNAHDTETGVYHPAAGTDHQVTSADATTLASLIILLNELSGDLTDHMADAVAHAGADVTNVVEAAAAANGNACTIPAVGVAVNDLIQWAVISGGSGAKTGVSAVAGTDIITITMSAPPVSDTIVSYSVFRK